MPTQHCNAHAGIPMRSHTREPGSLTPAARAPSSQRHPSDARRLRLHPAGRRHPRDLLLALDDARQRLGQRQHHLPGPPQCSGGLRDAYIRSVPVHNGGRPCSEAGPACSGLLAARRPART